MKNLRKLIISSTLVSLAFANIAHAEFTGIAHTIRKSPEMISVNWVNNNPVDIYLASNANATITQSKLVSPQNKNGAIDIPSTSSQRNYIILVDKKSKQEIKTAERVIPLEKGSNFRDLGGYAAAGGKHVKWGRIFRSGGSPMLTENDLKTIGELKLDDMIDLRSSDERVIAPTKITNINYHTYNYGFGAIVGTNQKAMRNGVDIYRNFPALFAPHLKIIFSELLGEDETLVYNCSAGQDRTGFVTAIILSTLGVSKETIIEDYHLSTQYRKPENEMPKIDVAMYPDNQTALMFAKYQSVPNYNVPTPLKTPEGKAFLEGAFEEIDTKWGGIDNYLKKEVGLTNLQIEKLKKLYLE